MTEYLSPEDVEELIHEERWALRDYNLLLSALGAPLPVFGEEVHPTLHDKGAALLAAINHNHPLYDGNKRLSWTVVVAFYALNDHRLHVDPAPGDAFIRSVAAGERTHEEIRSWLQEHSGKF